MISNQNLKCTRLKVKDARKNSWPDFLRNTDLKTGFPAVRIIALCQRAPADAIIQ